MADETSDVGGRPLRFETPEDLKTEADLYFANTDRPTLSGLAYALGIDRQTLYNYKKRDGFFDIIKSYRDRVEVKYEERLIYDNQVTGVIFALKNMGWKDKTETEHSGEMKVTQITGMVIN
jgi:hypothetical protein